jgi:hypothetical protein
MAEEHFFILKDTVLSIDLKNYTQGFTNAPEFTINSVTNGTVNQTGKSSAIEFEPDADGFASLSFVVIDNDGSSMSKSIQFFIGQVPKDTIYNPDYIPTNPPDTTDQSDIQIVQNEENLQSVYLYPNIASEFVYLYFPEESRSKIKMQIIDTYGRTIKSDAAYSPVETQNSIYIGDLSPGIYFINMNKNNKCLRTLKFIKY